MGVGEEGEDVSDMARPLTKLCAIYYVIAYRLAALIMASFRLTSTKSNGK